MDLLQCKFDISLYFDRCILTASPVASAMMNLTKNFMRVIPSEKKKVHLIPEAIVCHIDESSLFEHNVRNTTLSLKRGR